VVVAGASDKVFVIDSDSGKVFWEKTMTVATPGGAKGSHWLCPDALNADPVIGPAPELPGDKPGSNFGRGLAVYLIASDGKLHGFNLVNGEDVLPPVQFVPPLSKNWSLNLVGGVIYTT